MAASTLVREVLDRVSIALNDSSSQFVGWTERELVHALNDAQLAIAKFLPLASSRVDAIKLKPGTRQSIESIAAADCKPGDGSTPSVPILGNQVLRPVRNMGADGLTPGKVIRMVPGHTLDANDADWHTKTAAAVQSMVYDPGTPRYFYVRPGVPASPAVWIEIAYAAKPLPIPNTAAAGSEAYLATGSSTLAIGVADEHVDDLVNYVLARAYMKNTQEAADPAKASMFTSLFVGSLNAKVAAVTGTNPNLKTLPFAPTPIGQAS